MRIEVVEKNRKKENYISFTLLYAFIQIQLIHEKFPHNAPENVKKLAYQTQQQQKLEKKNKNKNGWRQIGIYERKKKIKQKCKCAVKHNLHVSYSSNHLLCVLYIFSFFAPPFHSISFFIAFFSFPLLLGIFFFSILLSSLNAIYTWIDRTYSIRIAQKKKNKCKM